VTDPGPATRGAAGTAGAAVGGRPPGSPAASAYGTQYTGGGNGSVQRRPDVSGRPQGSPPTTQLPARSSARRARLRVSNVSPWSVFKLSLVLSICLLIVLLVAVAALWFVLDKAGVFASVIDAASTLTDKSGGGIDKWLGFSRVMTIAALIGVVNVVVLTVLSTIGALLYNLCSDFVGGVDVTLVER